MEEFLLDNAKTYPRGHARLKALLDVIASDGLDDLDQSVLRSVGDGVYEIKERGGLARIWCYIDPDQSRVIILILARRKNPGSGDRSKEQSEHIALAKRLHKQYQTTPLPFEK